MEPKPTSDLLGLAPYGEAVKVAVEKAAETAQHFLTSLGGPAAAELGLLWRDKVRVWRAKNLASIATKTERFLAVDSDGVKLQAPPRLVVEVIEAGSLCEDDTLQSMWAGLLSSSCTPDGKDDASLLFADILKRLTAVDAMLVEYACKQAKTLVNAYGEVYALPLVVSYETLLDATGLRSRNSVHQHLTHLYCLGLVSPTEGMEHGLRLWNGPTEGISPSLTPLPTALELYARCQGSRQTLQKFYKAPVRAF